MGFFGFKNLQWSFTENAPKASSPSTGQRRETDNKGPQSFAAIRSAMKKLRAMDPMIGLQGGGDARAAKAQGKTPTATRHSPRDWDAISRDLSGPR